MKTSKLDATCYTATTVLATASLIRRAASDPREPASVADIRTRKKILAVLGSYSLESLLSEPMTSEISIRGEVVRGCKAASTDTVVKQMPHFPRVIPEMT